METFKIHQIYPQKFSLCKFNMYICKLAEHVHTPTFFLWLDKGLPDISYQIV